MKKKIISTIGLVLAVFTLVLAGCGAGTSEQGLEDISAAEGETLSEAGVLVLKVNPELGIKYNKEGVVTEVEGRNTDGQDILDQYPDFIGKDSGLVLEELITLMGEAGYFVDEVEGETRQIILELEPGSVLPDEKFLEKMTANIQSAASELDIDSDVQTNEDIISLEEVKEIALNHAEVAAEDAKFDDKELDEDDGDLLFELEFDTNGYEYEYDIHAITGEIVKSEKDRDDDQKLTQKETSKKQESSEAKATEQKSTKKNDTEQKSDKNQKTKQQTSEYIGMDRAKEIAFNHAGVNGAYARFDDQEFETDDGVPSYELEFKVNSNEYEYDIHAVSGNILKAEHDIKQAKKQESKLTTKKPAEKKLVSKPTEKRSTPKKTKELSKDEVINIALKHAGVSRSQVHFDDIERDWDDGRLEWEIEFDAGNWEYEYEIDGNSGNVLDYEKESND